MHSNQNQHQERYQQINQFQSNHHEELPADDDDFPEDDDLSQFAVDNPNQDPIPTNDFPDDDLDDFPDDDMNDGDLLLAASQVEEPGSGSSTSTFSDASKFSTPSAKVYSSTTPGLSGGCTAAFTTSALFWNESRAHF